MGNGQTYKPATGTDIDILARTVYGEARGECLAGQIQVAFTILKRAAIAAAYVAARGQPREHYGDGTILSACKATGQYDCWKVGDRNYAKVNSVGSSDADFRTCTYVAHATVLQQVPNRLPDATHYYNPDVVTHTPTWVTGVPAHDGKPAIPPAHFEATIGHHRFYSRVPA